MTDDNNDFDELEAIRESIARLNDRTARLDGQVRGATDRSHNISESADKVRLEAKLKRGTDARDQDEIKIQIKGDDPEDAARTLHETVRAVGENGTVNALRGTQPSEAGP